MRAKIFRKLVMVEHSIFALPWVLTGAILPFVDRDFARHFSWGDWSRWFWIVVAFFFARTAGMAWNRLVDFDFDAANPRTRERILPKGEATAKQVRMVAWVSVAGLFVAGLQINKICFMMAPVVAFLLWVYSYTKRFTAGCHLVLGIIQFLGPVLAWVAITDRIAIMPVLLGFSILSSIAGSDILYSLQDIDFDRRVGLHSIPVHLGKEASLWVVRGFHLLAVLGLVVLGLYLQAPLPFWIGMAMIVVLYLYNHLLIDIRRLDVISKVFFSCNASVGLALFLTTLGTVLWRILL